MKSNKFPVLIITLVTLVLLGFGVLYPMITLTMTANVDAGLVQFDNKVIDSTRSILGTAHELFLDKKYLVSALIFFFSIVIPLAKSILFLVSFYVKDQYRKNIDRILNVIAKWSMADVFVVAILLAYLATKDHIEASSKSVKVFAMQLDISFSASMQSKLEPGFYFFLSYCLISIACNQIFKASIEETSNES